MSLRMNSRQHDPQEDAIPEALGEAKRRWIQDGHVFLEDPGSLEPVLHVRRAQFRIGILTPLLRLLVRKVQRDDEATKELVLERRDRWPAPT
jgi:hypothetical protein